MEKPVFTGSFTQQEPIPEAAIEAAVAVMRSGRLHRYNLVPDDVGEVSRLEEEFAAFTGAKYCLAVASGGYAMSCVLRALGVGAGDKVLSNGFTLAPVPGRHRERRRGTRLRRDDRGADDRYRRSGRSRASQRRARSAAQPHAGAYLRHGSPDGGLRHAWRGGDRGLRPHHGGRRGTARPRGGTDWPPVTPRRPTSTSIRVRAG